MVELDAEVPDGTLWERSFMLIPADGGFTTDFSRSRASTI
jgi:hypothetical protein